MTTTYLLAMTNGRELIEQPGLTDRESAIDRLRQRLDCWGVVWECQSGASGKELSSRPVAFRPEAAAVSGGRSR